MGKFTKLSPTPRSRVPEDTSTCTDKQPQSTIACMYMRVHAASLTLAAGPMWRVGASEMLSPSFSARRARRSPLDAGALLSSPANPKYVHIKVYMLPLFICQDAKLQERELPLATKILLGPSVAQGCVVSCKSSSQLLFKVEGPQSRKGSRVQEHPEGV
jgi:hypothetical protein